MKRRIVACLVAACLLAPVSARGEEIEVVLKDAPAPFSGLLLDQDAAEGVVQDRLALRVCQSESDQLAEALKATSEQAPQDVKRAFYLGGAAGAVLTTITAVILYAVAK